MDAVGNNTDVIVELQNCGAISDVEETYNLGGGERLGTFVTRSFDTAIRAVPASVRVCVKVVNNGIVFDIGRL
jgi:hypothetical protein